MIFDVSREIKKDRQTARQTETKKREKKERQTDRIVI